MAALVNARLLLNAVTVSQLLRVLLRDSVELRRSAASLDARALVDRLAAEVAELRRRPAG